jgi:hypothetical protein
MGTARRRQHDLDLRHGLWCAVLVWALLAGGCTVFGGGEEPPEDRNPPAVPPPPDPDPEPDPDPDPDPDPPPSPAALRRAPYLQMLDSDSVVIAFHTANAMSAQVDYGTSTAYGATRLSATQTRHAVQLDGLQPGRRYFYRVRAGDETLAGGADYFFDTDAGRNDAEVAFFVTGDVGEPGGDQSATAARVLQIAPRAEIGILCGDIIYPDGESRGYDAHLMQPWARLLRSVAVWPALGNHDWHVDPETNFRAEWILPNNEHYFSFDRGPVHFVALDTRDGDIYQPAAQTAWLRGDLAAHRDATWTVVYYHHPGYTCTYKGDNDAVIERFLPVFDEFGVDVVFTGHAHTYERLYPLRGGVVMNRDQDPDYSDPDGTLYITTGCGAKINNSTTRDCDINAAQIDRTILVTHVTVRGRSLEIRTFESDGGELRDRVTITKSATALRPAGKLAPARPSGPAAADARRPETHAGAAPGCGDCAAPAWPQGGADPEVCGPALPVVTCGETSRGGVHAAALPARRAPGDSVPVG